MHLRRSGRSGDDFDEIPLMRSVSSDTNEETDVMSGDNDTEWLVGLRRRRKSPLLRCCESCQTACTNCCSRLTRFCRKERETHPRTIRIGHESSINHVQNAVRNQKYSVITFVPMVLFEQFRFFLNLYFLVMALSQFIPEIRVSYIWTYWGPLGFVISVTMIREAFDDFCRFLRDREMNGKKYGKLTVGGKINIPSSQIKVGDLIIVQKDQRIPADLVLLRTSEKQGSCFIRTDQLDGETDWKLRIPIPTTQHLLNDADIFALDAEVYAEKPQRDIHAFLGNFKLTDGETGVQEVPLNVENALWADTVLASGTAIGLVVYTGRETRSVMNASQPSSKVGLLDLELNNLTKLLFVVVVGLAFVMVCMKGFAGPWYRYWFRFILLFSYIIPISLRVNMDMAKLVYCWLISRDKSIPETIVRNSTVPEELGRVQFLLSDKTGTLTKNEMIFKKLHLGTVSFSPDAFDEISHHLRTAYVPGSSEGIVKHSLVSKIQQALEAIAICHNVTPMYEESGGESDETEADGQQRQAISYQAASPDEVALVSWSESVGLTLVHRDRTSLQLRTPSGEARRYTILQLFPFTSESKRMGIIVKDEKTGEIVYFMKGADVVMRTVVQYNDWLDEECSNMAREGLRTLVVAKKTLTEQQYQDFEKQYHQAKVSLNDRAGNMAAVLRRLEKDLALVCLTGVEDSLQNDVRATLELLKHAGIKVWMLTGDKRETAICIAKSSGLFSKTENIHVFGDVLNRVEAHTELNALRRKTDVALVITGSSLKMCLQHYESELAELVCGCTAVVCCRCSPEQKAGIVQLLIKYRSPQRVAAVGDGGNDVSMIQAAHAGIGIVGKEGKQASLAADFSITQFSHLLRLLLVHGRYCYKRSCSLSQFIMHRGLIISTMQAVFSCIFYFVSISLYQGMLMVAYSTVYTMFPVFSLVMDRDVKDTVALTYPELYKDLAKGRSLSFKTFFLWFLISVYQGAVIIYGALLLFDADFIHVVSISFTALIFTELVMVALTVHIWHWAMFLAEIFSITVYVISLLVLDNFFDRDFVLTTDFLWRTAAITAISCVPLYILKCLSRRFAPPSYAKVN